MNKPMTSTLFLASALLSANLCFAQQTEGPGATDEGAMPGQGPQPAQNEQEQQQEAQPVPETGGSDEGEAFAVSLKIEAGDEESYAEMDLGEITYDNFLVALLIAQSDSTMEINDQQFLDSGSLLALTAGSGSSAGMNLPGGLQGLADEVWIQVVLLDDQGHIHAGPVKKLSEVINEAAVEGGA